MEDINRATTATATVGDGSIKWAMTTTTFRSTVYKPRYDQCFFEDGGILGMRYRSCSFEDVVSAVATYTYTGSGRDSGGRRIIIATQATAAADVAHCQN